MLPENVLLNSITQDVAVGGGRYDIVNTGTYEVQGSWAKNQWLAPLDPLFAAMPEEDRKAYDLDDIIKTERDAPSALTASSMPSRFTARVRSRCTARTCSRKPD